MRVKRTAAKQNPGRSLEDALQGLPLKRRKETPVNNNITKLQRDIISVVDDCDYYSANNVDLNLSDRLGATQISSDRDSPELSTSAPSIILKIKHEPTKIKSKKLVSQPLDFSLPSRFRAPSCGDPVSDLVAKNGDIIANNESDVFVAVKTEIADCTDLTDMHGKHNAILNGFNNDEHIILATKDVIFDNISASPDKSPAVPVPLPVQLNSSSKANIIRNNHKQLLNHSAKSMLNNKSSDNNLKSSATLFNCGANAVPGTSANAKAALIASSAAAAAAALKMPNLLTSPSHSTAAAGAAAAAAASAGLFPFVPTAAAAAAATNSLWAAWLASNPILHAQHAINHQQLIAALNQLQAVQTALLSPQKSSSNSAALSTVAASKILSPEKDCNIVKNGRLFDSNDIFIANAAPTNAKSNKLASSSSRRNGFAKRSASPKPEEEEHTTILMTIDGELEDDNDEFNGDPDQFLINPVTGNKVRRNYKNMTRERRMEANARERTRVHTIGEAFEKLRRLVPSFASDQKLSKLSILRIACKYIMLLGAMSGKDYSLEQSQYSIADCTEMLSDTIAQESKLLKK